MISLLQSVVSLYLLAGLAINRLMERVTGRGPARSTVREWIASFAYGAGELLFDLLLRGLMRVKPLSELLDTAPPAHLHRVPSRTKRRCMERAHCFWQLTEHLYAQAKARLPRLHFTTDQLLSFALHRLQGEGVPPRLFWSPRLSTTPTEPLLAHPDILQPVRNQSDRILIFGPSLSGLLTHSRLTAYETRKKIPNRLSAESCL